MLEDNAVQGCALMTLPTIEGVVETSLYVTEMARSVQFYSKVLGFEPVDADERITAMSVGGRQILLLCKKGASRDGSVPHGGEGELHVAFAIPASQFQDWERRLAEHSVRIEHRRAWPRGGQSLYFRDPDRHLVELATPGVWTVY
jgi:catechol 2,3-dioxygenase-like lactoylglutathione lyase family enzyme